MNAEQANGGALHRYRFGSAEFDEARFELRVGGLAVELERRPLEVLALLLRHTDEVVGKDQLLATIWAGRVTVEHVLASAVAKLRKGLGEENAGRIVTQARVGYRLAGPVERIAVGRRMRNTLELRAGEPVPGRPHFVLHRQLAGSRANEVWLARHDKTGEARVYKFGADGDRLRALKREATLSRLLRESLGDREDIVRVVDWNFEEVPCFLECEYGGENLLEWAEHDGRLAEMSVPQRLQLALQAVEAVAAAHEAGVLHKDLKPANVLVVPRRDGTWQVKIADFGAGTVLEPDRLQELGVTPLGLTLDVAGSDGTSFGTPFYIAPEILAGAAPTARADVYSLGVMLYQLLAGDLRKPLTTGWEADIADPLLREDIAGATHGDPALRIASVAGLGERLRGLEQRRRQRQRLERAERDAEAARRGLERVRARRPWMAATLAVLVAGLGASLWLYGRASEARRAAETQAARAEATGAFLTDLLVNADPRTPGASGAVTVQEALGRAASGIAPRFAGDPSTEASVRATAGDLYAGLADYAAAVEHRDRAATLLAQVHGERDPRTLAARYRLAEALVEASRYDDAGEVLEAADATAAGVADREGTLALAGSRARARFHLMQADIEPAAAELERAIELMAAIRPQDAVGAYALRMDLSQCYSRLGRHQEAVAMLSEMQDARYADQGVSAAMRASASLYHGAALLYAGEYAQAEPALIRAIDDLTAVFGPESSQVVEAQSSLGNLYATSGRWAEALPVVATVRRRLCELHGAEHLTCMMSSGNEGVIELQLGRAEVAIGKLAPARDAFERNLGADSPGVHVLGYYLAMARLETENAAAAAPLVAALDPAKLASGSPGEQWDARVEGLRAWLQMGREQEGAARLEAAISVMEQGGVQPWIVQPYRRALEAGAVSGLR